MLTRRHSDEPIDNRIIANMFSYRAKEMYFSRLMIFMSSLLGVEKERLVSPIYNLYTEFYEQYLISDF